MKPWVKLHTEILDDRKMSKLTDRQYRVFINLLALAGIIDKDGALLCTEDLAYRLRMSEPDLESDLAALSSLNMVSKVGDVWHITHWEERQPTMPSETPEATRERKRQQREREKAEREANVTTSHDVTKSVTGVTTIEESRVEENRTEEKREEKKLAALAAKAASSLPNQVRVFEDNGGKYRTGKNKDGTTHKEHAMRYICECVKDTPESLLLWGRVVAGYTSQWSGTSYTIMVNDYYLNSRIPGQPKPNTNGKGYNNGSGARYGLDAIAQRDRERNIQPPDDGIDWDAPAPLPGKPT